MEDSFSQRKTKLHKLPFSGAHFPVYNFTNRLQVHAPFSSELT